jgi:hypothetical protein
MAEPQESRETSQKLGRLTIAVWILVAISSLNLLATLYGLWPFAREDSGSSSASALTREFRERGDPYADFFEWPLEKQIQAASVIALGEHRIQDGQVRTYIVEILKRKPGTTFHYKVGDEMGTRQAVRANTSYGDGQVMFFLGSPAQFRFSTSYRDGRVATLGGMPLELLRKQAQAQK